MPNVQTIKLEEIADFINGGAWNQTEYSDTGIPVVRVSDIHDCTVNLEGCKYLPKSAYERYAKHELHEGDLVICTVGSHPTQPNSVVGRPGIIPKSATGTLLNQNAVCVRPKNSTLDKTWLGYFARSQYVKDFIIAHARGSANQVRVAIGALKAMDVPLPNIESQKQVAEVLTAYDNLIENNNRRIAILEEMAQSLYQEWFVKFRFPGFKNIKFIDSPVGKVPEGWEVEALKDVLELAYGKALKKAHRKGGNVAVYGSGGIGGYHDEALVKGPCIIVGRKGNVGSIFWSESDAWPIDTVFYVKSEISHYFLYYNLLGQTFHNSDAAVPGLNRESAYSNKLVIPSEDILNKFEELIRPNFNTLNILRRKNENLKNQRELLLPKLISGKIDLPSDSN